MDFTMPECHDILPAACSGLCLASITCLAFVVLTYLQPVSPAEPIVKQERGGGSASSSSSSSGGEGSSSSSSGGEASSIGAQHTPNNAVGFTLPYGGLQHVASFDKVTPEMVNAALSGAKFLRSRRVRTVALQSSTSTVGSHCCLPIESKSLKQPGFAQLYKSQQVCKQCAADAWLAW
jgi:hypothetical protein